MDAIDGLSAAPLTAPAVTPAAAAPPATDVEAFASVLQRHLDRPRGDIAAIRSEIASIRSGDGLGAPRARADLFGGGASDLAATGRGSLGFTQMPGWLDAQLRTQATGDAGDPYGWRTASREIAEQVIGPGYGPLFERQIQQESGFNPEVVYGLRVSSAGAEGIAQLMPQYYPNVARTDPIAGLTAGAETMRHYLGVWNGDVRRALASYNAGLGRVQSLVRAHGDRWEAGLPLETRQYLGAILGPAAPVFGAAGLTPSGAVFGGRGPGGVLTAPLEGAAQRRATGVAVDYFGEAGAAVRSPSDGVVVEASGGRIVLDHGNGWRTALEGVEGAPGVGASVRRSDPLGTLAAGGLLRLSMTVDGAPRDPTAYLLDP